MTPKKLLELDAKIVLLKQDFDSFVNMTMVDVTVYDRIRGLVDGCQKIVYDELVETGVFIRPAVKPSAQTLGGRAAISPADPEFRESVGPFPPGLMP